MAARKKTIFSLGEGTPIQDYGALEAQAQQRIELQAQQQAQANAARQQELALQQQRADTQNRQFFASLAQRQAEQQALQGRSQDQMNLQRELAKGAQDAAARRQDASLRLQEALGLGGLAEREAARLQRGELAREGLGERISARKEKTKLTRDQMAQDKKLREASLALRRFGLHEAAEQFDLTHGLKKQQLEETRARGRRAETARKEDVAFRERDLKLRQTLGERRVAATEKRLQQQGAQAAQQRDMAIRAAVVQQVQKAGINFVNPTKDDVRKMQTLRTMLVSQFGPQADAIITQAVSGARPGALQAAEQEYTGPLGFLQAGLRTIASPLPGIDAPWTKTAERKGRIKKIFGN